MIGYALTTVLASLYIINNMDEIEKNHVTKIQKSISSEDGIIQEI